MNLHYVLTKKHPLITVSEGVLPEIAGLNGKKFFGAKFLKGAKRTFCISGATKYPQFSSGLDDIGWVAWQTRFLRWIGASAQLDMYYSVAPEETKRRFILEKQGLTRIELPSMLDAPDPFQDSDLVIEVTSDKADVFLASGSVVSRDSLLRLAKGVGCEIGPGPRPQIANGADTKVYYIEEKSPEEWRKLYSAADMQSNAWDAESYLIGKAHDLPFDDGTLDFIFSSHVFEHLYNPLGHLEHWRRKLKPGGVVLAVVPTTDGTKDFVHKPTSIIELIREREASSFNAPLEVFEQWASAVVGDGPQSKKKARQLYDDKFSIHVHTYDDHSANALLRHCISNLGYSSYRLRYCRNSKDMIFALKAA